MLRRGATGPRQGWVSLFHRGIDAINQLIQELHRRRVFRMLAYYVVVAWLLLQAADVLFPAWDIPESGIRYVLIAATLGLPAALVFSWFYDIGPEGLRRTPPPEADVPLSLRGRDYALLGALVLVMGAIGYGAFKDLRSTGDVESAPAVIRTGTEAGAEKNTPVVAVLPFSIEGTDEDSALFADGIQEDLLAQLAQLGSLRVISRNSVQDYRDTEKNARTIGQELGAGILVSGAVRVLGDQLRISAQLIDARTDSLLWADRFDRRLNTTNLFGVQGEIARTIARSIGAEVTLQDENRLSRIPTDSMAAYRAYRTATGGFDGNMTKPKFVEQLERAIELDPDFIEPMAELAGAYALRSRRPTSETESQIERAEFLIDRLNQLAPGSVDHLFAQAYYLYYVLNEYPRAIALVDRALEKNPSNLRLLQLKSWIQRRSGDLDGRAATLRRMMVLDPRQPSFRRSLLGTLFLQHRYDEVWAQMKPADALDPSLAFPYGVLSGRHLESLDARVDTLATVLEQHAEMNPWYRFMVPLLRRDYEAALEVARSVTDPPHWPDMPWTGSTQMQAIVAWAAEDEESLRVLVDGARMRAAKLLDQDPALAKDFYFRSAQAMIDALEGRGAETVRGARALEQETRNDLSRRQNELSVFCSLYAMVGHAGEATACLRMALTEPSTTEPFLEPWLPMYDPVRDSAEFQALLSEL